MKADENYSGEVKERKSWWLLVALFVVLGIIYLFSGSFQYKRSYQDVTSVRLIDAVLVEFNTTTEYHAPIFISRDEQHMLETRIEYANTIAFNKIVKGFILTKELYGAGRDSIQLALFKNPEIIKLMEETPVDTIIIDDLKFEARFLEYMAELKEIKMQNELIKQKAITDSIRKSNERKAMRLRSGQ